jgi:hypothetical protein
MNFYREGARAQRNAEVYVSSGRLQVIWLILACAQALEDLLAPCIYFAVLCVSAVKFLPPTPGNRNPEPGNKKCHLSKTAFLMRLIKSVDTSTPPSQLIHLLLKSLFELLVIIIDFETLILRDALIVFRYELVGGKLDGHVRFVSTSLRLHQLLT